MLVHGLSGSSRWWARNVGALAQRFRVHIVDLIGFGSSRDGHDFVLSEAADYLALWMERLEIERASVIGHSMQGDCILLGQGAAGASVAGEPTRPVSSRAR